MAIFNDVIFTRIYENKYYFSSSLIVWEEWDWERRFYWLLTHEFLCPQLFYLQKTNFLRNSRETKKSIVKGIFEIWQWSRKLNFIFTNSSSMQSSKQFSLQGSQYDKSVFRKLYYHLNEINISIHTFWCITDVEFIKTIKVLKNIRLKE